MLEQHLGQMQNDLSITNMKLNIQKQAIMGIIIGSIAIIILLAVGAYITFRFSSRVRSKISFISGVIDNLRSRLGETLSHIPLGNAFRRLLPLPLKMLMKEERKKKPTIKRPKFKGLKRMNRKCKREEPTMRWSDLHRDTLRDTQLTSGSHTYVTLEGSRAPQPQPRALYPNVDHLMTNLKTIDRDIENRERKIHSYQFNTLKKLDNDNMSVTARGSVASDLDQYESKENHQQ